MKPNILKNCESTNHKRKKSEHFVYIKEMYDGRFGILQVIGEGAYGVVYKAFDKKSQ